MVLPKPSFVFSTAAEAACHSEASDPFPAWTPMTLRPCRLKGSWSHLLKPSDQSPMSLIVFRTIVLRFGSDLDANRGDRLEAVFRQVVLQALPYSMRGLWENVLLTQCL